MEETAPGISRRTIVKGAAWSVPVIAAAVAVPLAAASAVTNSDANYFWKEPSATEWSTMTTDNWQLKGSYHVTGDYLGRANGTESQPTNETITYTVTFTQPVTVTGYSGQAWASASPAINSGPSDVWNFTNPTGGNLDLNVTIIGTQTGDISGFATMVVTTTNNPWIGWTEDPAQSNTVVLVA